MFEVEIEKLLNNGSGLARDSDGRVVFVPQALPGERVRIHEVKQRKGTAIATSFERLSTSRQRQEPECPQFSSCGGCDLLYLPSAHECHWKQQFLVDVMSRIGKRNDVRVTVEDFPLARSRFRGKLRLDRDGVCGFQERGSNCVVDVSPCLVLPPIVVREGLRLGALLHRHGWSGELWFLVAEDEASIAFEWTMYVKPRQDLAESLLEFCGQRIGIRIQRNKHSLWMEYGPSAIDFDWNGHQVALTPAQFMQANPAVWPAFWREVDHLVEAAQPQRVWDVHAGSGFLASRLPDLQLFASEPDARGVVQLKRLPQRRKQIFKGTAEAFLRVAGEGLHQLDAAILDPPRAGLTPLLRQWLIDHGPPYLLYFSCDMATFARDLNQLQTCYHMGEIRAFNMSPGTLKVESSVILRRKTD